MKNFVGFVIGLLYLPVALVIMCVTYITELGKEVIAMYTYNKKEKEK